jgi:cytochrome c oxidase subunit II
MNATLLWICVLLSILVFGVMLYSVACYQDPKRRGIAKARHKAAEILWAFVPILIIASAATPALKEWILGADVVLASAQE